MGSDMTKRRRRVSTDERLAPTPETVSKLAYDPLEKLNLNPDQERAADEIYRIVRSIYGKTMVHLASLDRFDGGLAIIPDNMARAHAERFLPWSRGNSASSISAALSIILDRELKPGTETMVRIALSDYVKRY